MRNRHLGKEDKLVVETYESSSRAKFTYTSETEPHVFDLSRISVELKCKNDKQKTLKQSIENNDITIATGPAGTGKTWVALVTALKLMKAYPTKYTKIRLVKSLQVIQGEEVGFLKGSLSEKLEPYMLSFTDILDEVLGDENYTRLMMESKQVEILPLAYVRGRTNKRCIVIVDESQNMNMHTFRTILTRIGEDCKMVFLGDIEQIDRKDHANSCLSKVSEIFENIDYVGSITFTDEESVRNPLIPELLKALR